MAAIDEITIPGGVCVFFTETGGVERSLGNIVGDSVSVDRESDEIEHFTNKSGIRRKDKIFTVEENAQIDFEIDEINVDNLRYFFKGASISTVGAGTTLITDQKATSAVEEFVSVGQPGLSPGVTARQFLDYCLVDTNGVFVNNSVETDTAAGTAFTGLVNTVTDFVYLGKLTQFSEVEFDMDTSGTGHTAIDYEYWDGTAWTSISVGLVDGTTNQTGDGILTYTLMTDWALTTVNGISAYWIRFSEPTTVTISATYFSIGRQALIEHTDFGVDPGSAAGAGATKNGGVRRIAAGILEPGEEFKVTFTYTTFVSQTFGIAEQSTIEGSARFVNNPQSGRGKHDANLITTVPWILMTRISKQSLCPWSYWTTVPWIPSIHSVL